MIDPDKYAMKLAMSISHSKELACDSCAAPLWKTSLDEDEEGHPVCIEADEYIDAPKLPGERHGRLVGRIVYKITVTAKYVDVESE